MTKPKVRYLVRVGQPAGLKWPAGLCYNKHTLSTWDEFAKVTGADLPGSCIVAKPVTAEARGAVMSKAKKARKAALALASEATYEIEDLTAALLAFYADARDAQDGEEKSFYLGRCITRRVAELNSAIMDVVAGGPENIDADAMAKVVYG